MALSAGLDAAVLLTMYFVDSPALRDEVATSMVLLDRIHTGVAALHGDLGHRLAADVLSTKVLEVDYVRETMRVEVRHRARKVPVPIQVPGQ